MASPSFELIDALRKAALQLSHGAHYAWGNHGACNCGHLLQVLTQQTEKEILAMAHTAPGEWTELAEETCVVSGLPAATLVTELQRAGLTPTDIHHLEYLDDKQVLAKLEGGFRWLKRNQRQDAIQYFNAFANLLEEKLLQQIDLNDIQTYQLSPAAERPQPILAFH